MYLARFSYDLLPVNRQRAIEFIRREVEAARGNGLNARLLVPLTAGTATAWRCNSKSNWPSSISWTSSATAASARAKRPAIGCMPSARC